MKDVSKVFENFIMSNIDFDITIVESVIGLSISYHISKLIPNIRILLLEKKKLV